MRDSEGQRVFGQLIYDSTTKKATGFELLSRGYQRDSNVLSQLDGMGIGFQLAIMNDQMHIAKMIHEKTGLTPSINVSNGILSDENSRRLMMSMLTSSELKMNIEIRESLYLPSSETCNKLFDSLKNKGKSICLSDFGTGFQGMPIFDKYHFDIVKIDKTVILNLSICQDRYRSIKMALDTISKLGLKTTLLGIETREIENIAVGLHSDEVQGFLYHKPVHWKILMDESIDRINSQ